jgi:lipopolysaccharide/colanic/teichoic acid biosynthesis glycosyltransferase
VNDPLASLRPQQTQSIDGMKRLGDLLIASLSVSLALPLMAIVALAIKLESPGPVFSLIERCGAGGRRFQMIKFRTETQTGERPWGRPLQITCVGHMLRWTRIDELPQLINVLRGDLTILGTGRPRPDLADW